MEFVKITKSSKDEIYKEIIPQIKSLLEGEDDSTANMANVTAVLKMAFASSVSWVGFYVLRGEELVLGPFQGKPACVRIKVGKGVCGTSVREKRTIIVPDVEQFPGHIYCDPDSKSEIVIPILIQGEARGVLDVDSAQLETFDDTDRKYLEMIGEMVSSSVR